MKKNNKLYQQALAYVVNGYSVIPLKKDKIPLLRKNTTYQRDRLPTENEVTSWWKEFPEANIGICTGKISNLTVVDIDGTDTPLSTFPQTYTVKTPTGGYHLYYTYDAEIKQTANTYPQFPHVDIRNDGGYVVAPPSHCVYTKNNKHVDGIYTVINNTSPQPFPRSLFIRKESKKINTASLLRSFPKMAEGDGRNDALTKIIGKTLNLVNTEDHETVVWPIVIAANKQFKKPLEEKEVRTIFDSIRGREDKKPLATVQFVRNDRGIVANEENVYRTIKNDPETSRKFRNNIFTGVIESSYAQTSWQSLQRLDVINVRMYLMSTYAHFVHISHSAVEDSIIRYAHEFKVSPPVEYFESLVWDKTPRLNSWIAKTYNTADDAYHQSIGSNWLKGMVKRIVNPGSKFDYVLVLEGRQGIKKSTSLAILGGAWHVETVFTPDNKDFFMLFGGKAIVEFSEGETLSRTEAKRLKAIITMQYDKYRPPYERSAQEFPRQCVFAMTTNQDQYLKDETGNRRWLPVACQGNVNVEWLRENRDQLYAEAYHRVITNNETTYEFPEEEMERQQSLRQSVDPREEQIYEWYFKKLTPSQRDEGITTRMAYVGGIHGGTLFGKEMGRLEETMIGSILKNVMKMDRRRVMENNNRFYRYFPSKETMGLMPMEFSGKEGLEEEVRKLEHDW